MSCSVGPLATPARHISVSNGKILQAHVGLPVAFRFRLGARDLFRRADFFLMMVFCSLPRNYRFNIRLVRGGPSISRCRDLVQGVSVDSIFAGINFDSA